MQKLTTNLSCFHCVLKDKKLEEMYDKQKNVLELMTDFLQEQEENKFHLCAMQNSIKEKLNKQSEEKPESNVNNKVFILFLDNCLSCFLF